MKHLTLFNNTADFESAVLVTPNVSLIKENNTLSYKPMESSIFPLYINSTGYTVGKIAHGWPEWCISFTFPEDSFDLFTFYKDKLVCPYPDYAPTFYAVPEEIIEKYPIYINNCKVMFAETYCENGPENVEPTSGWSIEVEQILEPIDGYEYVYPTDGCKIYFKPDGTYTLDVCANKL